MKSLLAALFNNSQSFALSFILLIFSVSVTSFALDYLKIISYAETDIFSIGLTLFLLASFYGGLVLYKRFNKKQF